LTKTFRLDEELLEGLRKAARHEGISENALVQDLISRRVKADPLVHAFPFIILSRRSFIPILGTANPDSLELVALELGRKNFTLTRELYKSTGKELGFSEYLVDVLDKQVHWFEVEGVENKPERLTLHHECGMKWSLFLKSFLTAAYEVMSKEKVRMVLNDTYVSLELPIHH
jgi:hypothetical protein